MVKQLFFIQYHVMKETSISKRIFPFLVDEELDVTKVTKKKKKKKKSEWSHL